MNLCDGSSLITSKVTCLLSGSDIIIYCAVPDSSVVWSNADLGTRPISNNAEKEILGPDIQLCFISIENNEGTNPPCTNASAAINNVSKTLDKLDIVCATTEILGKVVSQLFTLRVIGKKNCQYVSGFNSNC